MSIDHAGESELGAKVYNLRPGTRVFGRYDMVRKLGEGGFGAVWLATDTDLSEEIALKFVLQAVANSPEATDALKREAARSRKLTHPNIVRIHDFIAGKSAAGDNDLAAVSMEYVNGQSLGGLRLTRPGRHFAVADVALWIDPLCQALSYAHDPKRRVIHRDLKPANLLLSADGDLKIADFGIACSLVDSVSQISGRRSGTPAFMSPQQFSGEFPSESDDLYSLGATIYTLLTGTPPFHQGDLHVQIREKRPSSMAERLQRLELAETAAIPPEWEETVAACLEKEQANRPQSALEIAARLGFPSAQPRRFEPQFDGPIAVDAPTIQDLVPSLKAAPSSLVIPITEVGLSAGPAVADPTAPIDRKGGGDFDLDALLQMADLTAEAKKQTPGVRVPRVVRARAKSRSRARFWLLIAAGVTLLLLAAATVGFLSWRTRKVETLSRDLKQTRGKGDFAGGRGMAAGVPGILRNEEPLKTELERTTVAADLDLLREKTFSDAGLFLQTNRARLENPSIRSDPAIQDRLDQIRKWIKAGGDLLLLRQTIQEGAPGAAGYEDDLKKALSELGDKVAELDDPYRDSIEPEFAETARACVLARLQFLEREQKRGVRTNLGAYVKLTGDAARYDAPADVRSRIAALSTPVAVPPVPARPAEKTAPKPPVAEKQENPNDLLSLPTLTTYVATGSAAGYELSNVAELRPLSSLLNRGNIRLYHLPAPPLNPTNEGQETVLTNGKLYDGGKALLLLQKSALLAFDDRATESLKSGLGLRFDAAPEKFYVYLGGNGTSLISLPAPGWLKWNQKAAVLTLRTELGQALSRIKAAGSPARQFTLHAQSLGDFSAPIPPGDAGKPWPVNLAPVISSLEAALAARNAVPPATGAKAERLRAAKAARELLMGNSDNTRLSEPGLALFEGLDPAMTRFVPQATTANWAQAAKSPGDHLRNGRAYLELTQALLVRAVARIDAALSAQPAKSAQRNELLRQKTTIENVLREYELQVPGLSKARLDKVLAIWINWPHSAKFEVEPGKSFLTHWTTVFSPANIARIRPFLEWGLAENGEGDLDLEFARMTGNTTALERETAALTALLAKVRADFPSLGPFTIDLNEASHVATFTGTPATTTETPPPFK